MEIVASYLNQRPNTPAGAKEIFYHPILFIGISTANNLPKKLLLFLNSSRL
jgi:hypothetical protein